MLPEGSRIPGTMAFHRAVTDYFQKSCASMGVQLSVVFAAGRIEVAWEPPTAEAPAMASIGPLLQRRRFDEARPLLETLLQLQPEHPEALYNLGVLASEEGRLEEARLLLRRAVMANAGDTHAQANAQVALGLAALRQEDRSEARQALEAAIELEPRNAFALRSLGSLLVIAGALAAGIERFRQALVPRQPPWPIRDNQVGRCRLGNLRPYISRSARAGGPHSPPAAWSSPPGAAFIGAKLAPRVNVSSPYPGCLRRLPARRSASARRWLSPLISTMWQWCTNRSTAATVIELLGKISSQAVNG